MKTQKIILSLFLLLVSSSLLAMEPQPGYGVLGKIMAKPPTKPVSGRPLPPIPAPPQPITAPVEGQVEPATEELFLAAIHFDYIRIIDALRRNAQVNTHWEDPKRNVNISGHTPLMIWIKREWNPEHSILFQDGFNALIKAGANINARNSIDGKTVLHYVSEQPQLWRFYAQSMWDFLVKHGADPNIADNAGNLPTRPQIFG